MSQEGNGPENLLLLRLSTLGAGSLQRRHVVINQAACNHESMTDNDNMSMCSSDMTARDLEWYMQHDDDR